MARQVLQIPDVPATLLQAATAAATYAPIAHTHDALYLPLTGGTLSGNLISNGTLKSQGATSALLLGDRTNGAVHGWSVYSDADMLRFRNEWTGSQLLTVSPDGTTTCVPAVGTTTALVAQGNVGVGVTPKAWRSDYRAVQAGTTAALVGGAGLLFTQLRDNAYNDGSNERALATGAASFLQLSAGGLSFFNAPSVGAGATQTFTTRAAIAPTGTLTLSPDAGALGLTLNKPDAANYLLYQGFNRQGVGKWNLGMGPSDEFMLYNGDGSKIRFYVQPAGSLILQPDAGQPSINTAGPISLGTGTGMALIATAGTNMNIGIAAGQAFTIWEAGNAKVNYYGNQWYPAIDNQVSNGIGGNRWTTVFAVAPAINTSSIKMKDPRGDLDPARALAAVLRTPTRRFNYKNQEQVFSGYYMEEADPLFTIGPDQTSAGNDVGILMGAVQAQAAQIATLTQRIAALEARPA